MPEACFTNRNVVNPKQGILHASEKILNELVDWSEFTHSFQLKCATL